ncbi:hypothetical protein HN510_05125 [Candidatus Woesearchaeota archaeon]|jgi:hypothetical protein|nr:hypothetical protein [Candidatus Woesearchaeota archaeon]
MSNKGDSNTTGRIFTNLLNKNKQGHQRSTRTFAGKRGQQEIVGFVLIVVLVVVGLMIFLIYSFTSDRSEIRGNDIVLGNLMSSMISYTTNCTIQGEKQTIQNLFEMCYNGKKCDLDPRDSCIVLEAYLSEILGAAYSTESRIAGMNIEFYMDNAGAIEPVESFSTVSVGNCSYGNNRGFEMPLGGLDDVYIMLRGC